MTRTFLLRGNRKGVGFRAIECGLIGCLAVLVTASEANAEPLFFPSATYTVGDFPASVAVADLDGDSILDLAVANAGQSPATDNRVCVLLGNGDGSFEDCVFYGTGIAPGSVAAADLNDDAVPDLVTSNRVSDDVSVLLGNGDGSFQPAVSFSAGDRPFAVAVAHLDGDGVPDLVTANDGSDDVTVLLGNGDGSFQPALSFSVCCSPRSVAAADLNGDDVLDLATANFGSDDVSVLAGNGDGSFQPAVSYPAGDGPVSVAAAHLDGGSVLDLVTANRFSDDVSILLGNGEGTFQPAMSFSACCSPRSAAVADLNGDGVPDVVTANFGSDDVGVLAGNGDGSFEAAVAFLSGDGPRFVTVADFDDDRVPDLATANALSDGVAIHLGSDGPDAPDLFRDPQFGVQVTRGIVYGTGTVRAGFFVFEKNLLLDLYLPAGADAPELSPAMILIHGGGFTVGSRRQQEVARAAHSMAARGYVAVSIDYRLDEDLARPVTAPESQPAVDFLRSDPKSAPCGSASIVRCVAVYVASIEDTFKAHDWLVANADSLGMDPSRIAVGGHSAGAFISYGVAYHADNLFGDAPSFGAAMALSGGFEDGIPFVEAGETPLVLVHGDADGAVGFGGSVATVEAFQALGIPVEFYPLAGVGHFLAAELFGDEVEPGVTVFDRAAQFIYFHLFAAPSIDIQPGSSSNRIDPMSRGVVPVAVLGTEALDVRDIQVETLSFGPGRAESVLPLTNPGIFHFFSHFDVDHDGLKDLFALYRSEDTGLAIGDTQACMQGETLEGRAFQACDQVTTVSHACGIGFELVLVLPPLMWMYRRRSQMPCKAC